jgi:hypothetical protein
LNIQEVDDFPESEVCPLCSYRGMFSWKAATSVHIPLRDLQRGFCDTCLSWLSAQTGILTDGAFEFEKRRTADSTSD